MWRRILKTLKIFQVEQWRIRNQLTLTSDNWAKKNLIYMRFLLPLSSKPARRPEWLVKPQLFSNFRKICFTAKFFIFAQPIKLMFHILSPARLNGLSNLSVIHRNTEVWSLSNLLLFGLKSKVKRSSKCQLLSMNSYRMLCFSFLSRNTIDHYLTDNFRRLVFHVFVN